MIGKDSSWKRVNDSNEARYTKIKQGRYTFVLQEYDGKMIMKEKKIHFTRINFLDDTMFFDACFLLTNLLFIIVFYSFGGNLKKLAKVQFKK